MIGKYATGFVVAWILMGAVCATSLELLSEGSRPLDLDRYTSISLQKDRVNAQIETEQDPKRKRELDNEKSRLSTALWRMEATSITMAARQLQAAWRNATDPQAKQKAGAMLLKFADRFSLNDIRHELKYGERLKQTEIKSAIEPTTITLTPIREFEELAFKGESENRWKARRITADRFELWRPTEGWLFDAHGELLHQARTFPVDGRWISWWGAFLPDGSWATHQPESGRQLLVHTADGTLLKTIMIVDFLKAVEKIVKPEDAKYFGRIDWAQSDAEGKGWIVQISQDGEHYFRVLANGDLKPISIAEVHVAVYRRALGPQGFSPMIPSDDGSRWLMMGVVRHGPASDTPFYMVKLSLNEKEPWRAFVDRLQPGEFGMSIFGGSFDAGFWPDGHEIFVVVGANNNRTTWFFSQSGELAAWVNARHIADARDGKGMLFESPDGSILTISPEHKIKASRRFVWPDGAPAKIEMIFANLNLGLFRKDRAVWLAAWK